MAEISAVGSSPGRQACNELRPKITPLVEFSKENTSDGVLLKTVKKKEIEEIAGSSSTSISGSWQQTVRFPDSAGGQYRLSFQHHSVQTGKYGMSGFIVLSFKNGKNVKTEVKTFSVGSGTWQNYVTDINVPVGYDAMDIYLRLDGCGEILFKNPLLEKVTAGYPAAVILAPGALLDNTFALSQKGPCRPDVCLETECPERSMETERPCAACSASSGNQARRNRSDAEPEKP